MKKDLLGIGWLNGRLEVVGGGESGSACVWTAPGPVLDGPALTSALAAARRELKSPAGRTVWVIDHRSLLFHVQETPPTAGRVLDQVLDRLVAENRFFEEPALWRRTPLPPGARRPRCLLAVMPSSLRDCIEEACQANGLVLAGLHPVATAIATLLPSSASPGDEAMLLLAGQGDQFNLVVSNGAGQVLFARSLTESDELRGGRLDQEIKRTLHFTQQQFGVAVNRVVPFGASARRALSGRLPEEGLTVEPGLVELKAGDLTRQGVVAGKGLPFNFAVDPSAWNPWVRPALAAGLAGLLGLSIFAAISTERDVRERQRDLQHSLQERNAGIALAEAREEVQRDARRLSSLARLVEGTEASRLPATWMRYLVEVVPPAIRLTGVDLDRTTNGWRIHLEGATAAQGSRFLALIEELETQLQSGVFKAEVLDSTHRRTATGGLAGIPEPPRISEHGARGDERVFFLSGLIR